MKKISVQYFTTVKEVFNFCKQVCLTNKLYAAHLFTLNNDDHTKIISCDYFENDENINPAIYNCFVLSRERINTDKKKHYDFQIANQNSLYINVGVAGQTFMRESWIYALKIINDKNDHKIWLQVEKELKQNTFCGGWGIYKPTGEKEYYKDLRYTAGAKSMYENGVTMLSRIGDKIYFELEKR